MSISSAPALTASWTSASFTASEARPDGNAVATEATATLLPATACFATATRSGYTQTAATGGASASGWRALAHMARTLPGVSAPSSVVRSTIWMARSRAASFASFLMDRVARAATRSPTPTWSMPGSPCSTWRSPASEVATSATSNCQRPGPWRSSDSIPTIPTLPQRPSTSAPPAAPSADALQDQARWLGRLGPDLERPGQRLERALEPAWVVRTEFEHRLTRLHALARLGQADDPGCSRHRIFLPGPPGTEAPGGDADRAGIKDTQPARRIRPHDLGMQRRRQVSVRIAALGRDHRAVPVQRPPVGERGGRVGVEAG